MYRVGQLNLDLAVSVEPSRVHVCMTRYDPYSMISKRIIKVLHLEVHMMENRSNFEMENRSFKTENRSFEMENRSFEMRQRVVILVGWQG